MPAGVAEATARVAPVPFSHDVRVEVQELAGGVWLMGGGTHNSVAVEFDGFVAVVEAPLNEARSLAVIEEVTRLAPGKPIRYIVNTHDHWEIETLVPVHGPPIPWSEFESYVESAQD